METQMEQKVTKDMTIGEVVRKYPAAAEIMLSYGLHCVGDLGEGHSKERREDSRAWPRQLSNL